MLLLSADNRFIKDCLLLKGSCLYAVEGQGRQRNKRELFVSFQIVYIEYMICKHFVDNIFKQAWAAFSKKYKLEKKTHWTDTCYSDWLTNHETTDLGI